MTIRKAASSAHCSSNIVVTGDFSMYTKSANIEEAAIQAVVNADSVIQGGTMPKGERDCHQEQVKDDRCYAV